MSDQRKLRADARQGFHQFAMHMYQSYLQTSSEQEAKALVVESIKEQLRLFMGSNASFSSVEETIQGYIDNLKEGLDAQESYDQQMYYAEQIDTLERALDILGFEEYSRGKTVEKE